MKLLALITSIMILSACNEVDVGEEIRPVAISEAKYGQAN